MALATLPQLEDHLGQSFGADDDLRALQALDEASQIIRTYTSQDITQGSSVATFVYGIDSSLRLQQRPVTAVSSLTVDGLTMSGVSFTSDGWVYETGSLLGGWPFRWRGTVVVNYTHGYAMVPDDIRFVCVTLAARIMENPTMAPREGMGAYDISYAQSGFNLGAGGSITDNERSILDSYRAVVVA